MYDILRLASKTSITTHLEITCISVVVCNLVDYLMIGFAPLSWCFWWNWRINYVRYQGSMVPVNLIHSERGAEWRQVQELNDCVLAGVALDGFVSVIGIPIMIILSLVLWDCSRRRTY